MKEYKVIEGDLIELAKAGEFDVIVHGCNCFCTMGAGLALKMAKEFGCDDYTLESDQQNGNANKLGMIDFKYYSAPATLFVVNAYTQFQPGRGVDYDAIALVMKKTNHFFREKRIGLPKIGCGIAGGDWSYVDMIIREHLPDCDVTIVEFKEKENVEQKNESVLGEPITPGDLFKPGTEIQG